MFKNYFAPLALNLSIVLAAFVVFIFLDSNIGKAKEHENNNFNSSSNIVSSVTDSNSVSSVPAQLPIASSAASYDFKSIPPFDWSTNHYIDENVLNNDTNFTTVSSGNNGKYEIAFYSQKKSYYRFEIARFILKGNVPLQQTYVRVFHNGSVVLPYMSQTNIYFVKDRTSGEFEANYFQSWSPKLGEYEAVLYLNNNPILSNKFEIIKREPVKFNRMMTFINLEWNQMITKRTIYNHNFQKVQFTDGLKDWMNYGDVDGFLTLSGETTGWGKLTPEKPWEYYPVKNLQLLGEDLHKNGKMVGAYIMCFYTPQNGWEKTGYSPAKGVSYSGSNEIYVTGSRFASFKDPKRFKDIVALAKYFNSLPYVDFIGFDFIRFGELVGYENADEFVRDMNVAVPSNWGKYSENDQIIWLSQKVKSSTSVLERWKLWIAHKTADFIYRVRIEAGLTKPVWIFTLGWNHGTEHGQDPYFFQDAGALADNVMLYESTPDMFEAMKKSWADYTKSEQLNYIPGNQIDAVLSRSLFGNNAVEEYYYRLTAAVDYAPYLSRGMFIHDISRAFWGRKGSYTYYEWLVSGLSSLSYGRFRNKEIPYQIKLPQKVSYKNSSEVYIPVEIEIVPSGLSRIQGKTLSIEGIGNNYFQKIDISEKTNIILSVKMNPGKGSVQYLAFRGKIDGYPAYFTFSYIKFYRNSKIHNASEPAQQEREAGNKAIP